MEDPPTALRNEIARIKEGQKELLLQHLKRALGTPEEELAARRYLRLRNELRDLRVAPVAAPAEAPA